MNRFDPKNEKLTKYLFYTGKGGVGKTSVACATAVSLADSGKRVLLISTDPASNLQDVFGIALNQSGVPINDVPGLVVANLDPLQAAADYRESVVGPYRGKLPDAVIANMEEQLSGSCTVEIAAFNEFSRFITDGQTAAEYDHIIFDTAPTGHTLRMLQLPSAWSGFISESTHGASCLGQLSGLEDKKDMYKNAVTTLSDGGLTSLFLVARPEETPLKEAARASHELAQLGVVNQYMIINGVLEQWDDSASRKLFEKQQSALAAMPDALRAIPTYEVPLRAFNVTGTDRIRMLLEGDEISLQSETLVPTQIPRLRDVVDDLCASGKRVIFTMGKGGVGKTTVAAAIALGLAERGEKVHLATTDPAAHLKYVLDGTESFSMSHIDEKAELKKYREEVLAKARQTMSEADVAYVEEDLRSPCTQEIAVFRAFAEIVERAEDQTVIIDTAPTGHTLLLLDSTQSYHREVRRTQGGEIPDSVRHLLPRLRSTQTEVLIVTLAETTPVYEALRLEDDLKRAGIAAKWWIINASLYGADTANALLTAKANQEIRWINEVAEHTGGSFALIGWQPEEIKGAQIKGLFDK